MGLLNEGIFDFTPSTINDVLKQNYDIKESIFSFNPGCEVEGVPLIEGLIDGIIVEGLREGITEQKELIKRVFNEMQGPQTPEISTIKVRLSTLVGT